MPSNAQSQFIAQMGFVEQLIVIHRKLQSGRGRRHEQDALHRAGVVMSVAAWESYIERVVMEALDAIERSAGVAAGAAAPPVPAWARHAFALRRAEIAKQVRRFNTPSDVEVRDLFQESLEFAPWPSWSWQAGPRQWDEDGVRSRLRDWMLVRHSVAHGFPLPADVAWLQDAQQRSRLTLALLKDCKQFFSRLVTHTDASLGLWLRNHHGVPAPW